MFENHHKLKTYREFIDHFMPIIYKEYVKQFTSTPMEDVLDLYPYIQIHFGYSKNRRASEYMINKRVMKRKTIIGEPRKKKRTRKKKHVQEVRTDRKPTRTEIKSKEKTRNQQVTTKVFNHIFTEETIEIIESKNTLEVLEMTEEPMEVINEIVPVVDIEFVTKSITTEVDSTKCVESKGENKALILLEEELKSKNQYIEYLVEEKDKLTRSLDIKKKYESIQSGKIRHLLRAIEYFKLKVSIYQQSCRCRIKFDEMKLQTIVNKIITDQDEEAQNNADSDLG